MFPTNDEQFQEYKIEGVSKQEDGTYAITCDGWSLWCGKDWRTEPQVGQIARQYGRGIGHPVRGLFIDGAKVWYRTEAEDAEHHEIERYGADAADWLARWDAGRTVWTIEMGGLGPGYEQCIHIVAAEVVRFLIDNKIDCEVEYKEGPWAILRDKIEEAIFANPQIKDLGLSGAQVGAAMSIATKLYRDGPRHIMNVPEIKDRHIQVSRHFPSLAA
jgi:hypothetical protein